VWHRGVEGLTQKAFNIGTLATAQLKVRQETSQAVIIVIVPIVLGQ